MCGETMMDGLTFWDVLDILNCLFQGVIAIAAVVAIWITVKQISGRANVNLKMKTEFRLNETREGEFFVELVIHMVNLGMAPVYISSSGVQLWEHRKPKFKMRLSDDSFVLKSGESRSVCGQYKSEMLDDKASLHDKVRIYAVCQMDKVFYEKKSCSYDEFQHECEKIRKRVDKLAQEI